MSLATAREGGRLVRQGERHGQPVSGKGGVIVGWKLPGGELQPGIPPARAAKFVGAVVHVKSSVRSFRIYHHDNWGDERFPWRLTERYVLGSEPGFSEDSRCEWVEVETFPSLREAVAEARRLARASVIRGKEARR